MDDDRRPATVIFADISGSVGIYATKGDTVAFQLNSQCLQILETEVRRCKGQVIKRAGDAILAIFECAEEAVQAAASMVAAAGEPASGLGTHGVRVRVGISHGPVVRSEGDVYGDQVNIAARLVSIAGPDEILLSGAVYEALSAAARAPAHLIDELSLRGRPLSVPAYRYLWRVDDATVSLPGRMPVTRAVLTLTRGPDTFVVDQDRPKLRIGRAPDNDLVLGRGMVSRYHAEIALRGDKFTLADRSTNGTEVRVDGGPVLRICRDEMMLVGNGQIAMGEAGGEALRYEIGVQFDEG